MVAGKLNFALEGSLIDLNTQSIPNFDRPSSVAMERTFENSLQLYMIEAFRPAISYDNGAFMLQPFAINEVNWNMDLNQSVWVKGSNVTVRPDLVLAPDSTRLADRVSWLPKEATSDPDNQVVRRIVELEADTDYHFSAFIRLRSGQFTAADVIKFYGAGASTPANINLSQINRQQNRYVVIEGDFRTSRNTVQNRPVWNVTSEYSVTNFTETTVTISITPPAGTTISANNFVGGQVVFSNIETKDFDISANTAVSGNSMTITFPVGTNLVSEGVTLASKVAIKDAPRVNVTMDIYVESNVVLDWGGCQIEKGTIRTSMVYQQSEVEPRGGDTLVYRESPIRGLKTFGVYTEIDFWRGAGMVWDFGNVECRIDTAGYLYVKAGTTEIRSINVIPATNVKVFTQVAEESASFSLYINGKLDARTSLANFTADAAGALEFTSDGVRSIQRFFTTDSLIAEGQSEVGGNASGSVTEVFSNPVIIDPVAISSNAPSFLLPPVVIPAPEEPTAYSYVTSVTVGTNQVTLSDASAFSVGNSVTFMRDGFRIIQFAVVTAKSSNTLTLTSVNSALLGDIAVVGNYDLPGQTACRFPFTPKDAQTVTAIDVPTNRLTVGSALGFDVGRAIIQTSVYQDVAEVLISSIDTVNRYLFVDNVSEISVGDTISQPFDELIVNPHNYFASLLRQIDGVRVAKKYRNGLLIENSNNTAILARPFVRVFM